MHNKSSNEQALVIRRYGGTSIFDELSFEINYEIHKYFLKWVNLVF